MMPEDPKTLIIPPSPFVSRAQPALHGGDVGSCRARRAAAAVAGRRAVQELPVAGPARGRPVCTHRDVLPMAGREGFNAEAWCPDCSFFKVRRAPRKRPEY